MDHALLTARAADKSGVQPFRGVAGKCAAHADDLVVGMGMDGQERQGIVHENSVSSLSCQPSAISCASLSLVVSLCVGRFPNRDLHVHDHLTGSGRQPMAE